MKIKKSYKYRLYPNRKIMHKMENTLKICRQVYNEMLSIKQATYEVVRERMSEYNMNNCIRYGIDFDISNIHSLVLLNINNRIDKAYANFFRRLKEKRAGKKIKVGYPRFKKRYKSFTYRQSGFGLEGNKLTLSKIGTVNVRIGRTQNRISGKVKTLTIKREPSGKWFAIFSCIDVPVQRLKSNKKKIGIDVGLEYFATLSNDMIIDNPRFMVHSERRLRILQRRLSRKRFHGKNWQKAKYKVALLHEHIANQRYDFHHQLTSPNHQRKPINLLIGMNLAFC